MADSEKHRAETAERHRIRDKQATCKHTGASLTGTALRPWVCLHCGKKLSRGEMHNG